MKSKTLLILSLAMWPAYALAYSGSETDQQACTQDVFNLCSDFIPDEGPIVACLQSKRAQLSQGCAQVLFPQHHRRSRAS